MSEISKPLAQVEHVFQEPVKPEAIKTHLDEAGYRKLRAVQTALEGVIDFHINRLGFSGVQPINLRINDREKLAATIKGDCHWKDLYREAVSLSGIDPQASFEEQLESITIPDFNEIGVSSENIKYNGGVVEADFRVHHSYAALLDRKRLAGRKDFNAVSVYGITKTCSSAIMLGVRAGRTWIGGIMPMPAGYVKISERNGVPVVEPTATFVDELYEETGLASRYDLDLPGLIAVTRDRKISNNVGFVYLAETLYAPEQMKIIWDEHAKDRGEHSKVFFVAEDRLLGYIEEKADRLTKTWSLESGYPLLSPGAAVLLAHGIRINQEGTRALLAKLDAYTINL